MNTPFAAGFGARLPLFEYSLLRIEPSRQGDDDDFRKQNPRIIARTVDDCAPSPPYFGANHAPKAHSDDSCSRGQKHE
jgi:hypothetical protein